MPAGLPIKWIAYKKAAAIQLGKLRQSTKTGSQPMKATVAWLAASVRHYSPGNVQTGQRK